MAVTSWSGLHAKLHQTLRQRELLPSGSRLLVAVSGGQDSVCLIKLLLDLQSKWQWVIAIAHCDHRWSSDVGMADHVQQLALDWGVSFYLKTAAEPIKETEAAAREWRYMMLTEIAIEEKLEYIVTAHTQSDRAETLLYNLMRGAGTDGLSAMIWQRFLTPEIKLIRPLLNITRRETGQFCQELQLSVWEDMVNQNLKYARNRIRNDLLPYLENHFNPQVEIALAQTAEILNAEAEYLENFAKTILEEAIIENQNGLNRQVLRNFPLAIQRRIIRQFLATFFHQSPNFEQIENVVFLITAPNRSRTSSLLKGFSAEVQGNYIIFRNS